jgi:hypothetical protein
LKNRKWSEKMGSKKQSKKDIVKKRIGTRREKVKNNSILNRYFTLLIDVSVELIHAVTVNERLTKQLELLENFVDLSAINPWFGEKSRESERLYLEMGNSMVTLLMMKCILDYDILRGLCLMPPKGVPIDQWRCCLGPCGIKTWLVQDPLVVRELQRRVRDEENEEELVEFRDQVWSGRYWVQPEKEPKNFAWAKLAHALLLPVRALHPSVKETILKEAPNLISIVDSLFICPEHIQKCKVSDPGEKKSFYERTINFYSLDLINRQIEEGKLYFSKGVKKLGKADIGVFKNIQFDFKEAVDPGQIPDLREKIRRMMSKMIELHRDNELVRLIDQVPGLTSVRV